MNKEEWLKVMEIVNEVRHDFEFQYRDLETLFSDGFNHCRAKIENKLLDLRPKE